MESVSRYPTSHLDVTTTFADCQSYGHVKYRTNDEGAGTMLLKIHPNPELIRTSIITASDDYQDGYATRLYRLMYDRDPDYSKVPG